MAPLPLSCCDLTAHGFVVASTQPPGFIAPSGRPRGVAALSRWPPDVASSTFGCRRTIRMTPGHRCVVPTPSGRPSDAVVLTSRPRGRADVLTPSRRPPIVVTPACRPHSAVAPSEINLIVIMMQSIRQCYGLINSIDLFHSIDGSVG